MSEEEVPPARAEDVEFLRKLSWVEERFRELRFNDMQAESLAEAGVDWHAAKELIDRGCSHEYAVDILL